LACRRRRSPFHHIVEYVRFNWSESGAASFGVEGSWAYARILLALPLLPATVALLRKSHEARASFWRPGCI
jgi:hypothetical protein